MSLTSEEQKQITRKLKHWTDNDRLVVTYREVIRELGCHVNLAKNVLLAHANANEHLHVTYLLSGQLLASSSIAQTQLPGDQLQLDEKTLAKLAASQKVKIVDMDVVSDGERNSEDGLEDDESGLQADVMMTNDKGGDGGISGKGDVDVNVEEEEVITPEATPRWGMILVAQDDFEEKRALFEPDGFGCHVYALSAAVVKDPAQYLIPYTQLRSHQRYIDPEKYGSIAGDLAGPSKAGGVQARSATTGTVAGKTELKGPKQGEEAKSATDAKGTKPAVVKKEPETFKDTKPAVLPKGAPTAGPSKASKSTAPSKPTESTEPANPLSRKASQKARKRVIASDDEADDDAPAEYVNTDTLAPPSSDPPEITSSMVRADDAAAMEAMLDMDMDDFDIEAGGDSGGKVKQETTKPKQTVTTAVKSGGRKRRMVKKTKTEKDAKGYMVTRDYESEESYSGESEPETTVKPSKARKSDTATKNGGSRASSVSTDVGAGEEKKRANTASSSSLAGSTAGGAGAKPRPPPNKPGVVKQKGQSTLAGFFKKK